MKHGPVQQGVEAGEAGASDGASQRTPSVWGTILEQTEAV